MPDNSTWCVYPFHICLKGTEDAVLCRDREDYDMFVKIIFLSALAKNVLVIIYIAVSNHCHVSVLASCQEDADACGEEIKRRYSMWLNHKYSERGVMKGVSSTAIAMTDRKHVRNALAYIPRNALDNGCNVNEYKWSGYRGMFCKKQVSGLRPVKSLSTREVRTLFHTADKLSNVSWMLNPDNELEPVSCCDHDYLEQAFERDQAYFLRTIGSLDMQETRYTLEEMPFNMLCDSDFFNKVQDVSMRWYGKKLSELTLEKKYKLLSYLYRTNKTTASQLSRVLSLDKETVKAILRI